MRWQRKERANGAIALPVLPVARALGAFMVPTIAKAGDVRTRAEAASETALCRSVFARTLRSEQDFGDCRLPFNSNNGRSENAEKSSLSVFHGLLLSGFVA